MGGVSPARSPWRATRLRACRRHGRPWPMLCVLRLLSRRLVTSRFVPIREGTRLDALQDRGISKTRRLNGFETLVGDEEGAVNVLVTGATGFLGGWVTRAFLHAGHSVRVLVRRPDRADGLKRLGVDVAQGDILSPDSLDSALSGVKAIAHCAGSVSRSRRDRASVRLANVTGTRNVLEAAGAKRIRVLHTSSIACMGPTFEPRLLDETTPGTPLAFDFPYVESKRESEQLALSYAEDGLDVVVLNPGSVMGPADPYYGSTELPLRYLRGELRMYPRGGMSFCDVRDVAAAYVAALDRAVSGERYILAGVNFSYREVQDELQRLTGLHRCLALPIGVGQAAALWSDIGAIFWRHPFENLNQAVVQWGSMFHYCSSEKAQRDLGYRTRDFSETLAHTIVDHLQRGGAHAATAELRELLRRHASSSRRFALG
jgi:dihydroflavonol-4-reductase